ncbi:nucleoside triphosphate pyrophosphohydrolase [Deltaproteobacteria bacterium OttesenSCG-928-M10]|nr:nucleoside triphosphate pyrophosphohydrolase [Deltaproteobacteria bacterium OttesenSCG-928-M10]
MSENKNPGRALAELDEVVARLLDPEKGCPWDIKQTPQTITGNILEETYELIEALKGDSPGDIREEAGDVLFQVVFIGRLAMARWGYGLTEIIDQVKAKMVFRHPHVFGEGRPMEDAQAVLDQWQAIKRQDKKHERLLASVPLALPALQRAHRLNDRAGRAGFDWPDAAAVRQKVDAELAELDELLPGYDKKTVAPDKKARAKAELGDVLLALANLSRHLGFSAEDALSEANGRFVARWNYIEDRLAEEGRRPENVEQERLEELWQEAKRPAMA